MRQEIKKAFLWSILVLGLCIASIFVARQNAAAGRFVWQQLHAGMLASVLSPSDPNLFFDMGNYYFGGGAYDLKKAEAYFRKALTLDPSMEGPHYQLARVYFIRSDFPDALAEINAELALHPDFGRSYYVRGLIYGYSGQLAKAEADFKAFLAWKPESWAGNNDLAWIYFQEGKYAEARDTARTGLKIEPNNPWLWNSLGVALLNMDDKKGAKEAFAKALSILATMSEASWGAAYPGNNPDIYTEGFLKMKSSLEENMRLLSTGDTGSAS